jgi:hypothetical protein
MVVILSFSYGGKDIVIGLQQGITFNDTYENVGEKMIDSYIENLSSDEQHKVMLHYWHMDETKTPEKIYRILHGVVSGHKRLADTTFVHTSPVISYEIDYEKGELIATTINTIYHCPLAYCKFTEQEKTADLIPHFEKIKEEYSGKIIMPEIEAGNVLLVLSNFDDYYFHSLYCKKTNEDEPVDYHTYPHVGMFQDSFLIQSEEENIDLRYFPHYRNIEFYSQDTDNMPLYMENIGTLAIYCKTSCGLIKLEPGDRKKVCKENAENVAIDLPKGDLYPAGFDDVR